MNTTIARYKGLVFAVHPTKRGFGWVIFEGPMSPVDWGIASARTSRRTRLLARFERLLKRYEPAVLVLERFEGTDIKRSEDAQRLCRAMRHLASCAGMDTPVYNRSAVGTCFAGLGALTRYEIAQAIAQHIDAFRHRLPPPRKPWFAQDPRQALFDAAALAITHFAVSGHEL